MMTGSWPCKGISLKSSGVVNIPVRFYTAVRQYVDSKIVLTFQSFGRTEGEGLLFLKGISHFFPGSSKARLQDLLNVVRQSHFKIFQLVGKK